MDFMDKNEESLKENPFARNLTTAPEIKEEIPTVEQVDTERIDETQPQSEEVSEETTDKNAD